MRIYGKFLKRPVYLSKKQVGFFLTGLTLMLIGFHIGSSQSPMPLTNTELQELNPPNEKKESSISQTKKKSAD